MIFQENFLYHFLTAISDCSYFNLFA